MLVVEGIEIIGLYECIWELGVGYTLIWLESIGDGFLVDERIDSEVFANFPQKLEKVHSLIELIVVEE